MHLQYVEGSICKSYECVHKLKGKLLFYFIFFLHFRSLDFDMNYSLE